MKRVLLIAFHYPPFKASSGIQRTLAYSRGLQDFGWQPTVLTVRPMAYDHVGHDQVADIPDGVKVIRTLAFDAARHFALRGRYFSSLAIPDRWRSWSITAVPAGLRWIRQLGIDAVWSTYPIATAHRIGAALTQKTRLPWVADFRDPMVEQDERTGEWTPDDPALRAARLAVEEQCARRAQRLVFCSDGARDIVCARHPTVAATRCEVIPNGYDERAFQDAARLPAPAQAVGRRVLLHSGTIYLGQDRDPSHLFLAVRQLLDSGELTPATFELRLRNPSSNAELGELTRKFGVEHVVSILPGLPYREALAEMLNADGLLLLQGITSNPAIPAKLYEYLRANRPLLALVHPDGDTARTLHAVGLHQAVAPTDADAIRELLRVWLRPADAPSLTLADPSIARRYSRRESTQRLASLLDSLA